MYIERVPNRSSPPAILLRESFREGDRVRKRTIANISNWPSAKIEALRAVLAGTAGLVGKLEDAFEIVRSRAHGHVAAVLGEAQRLKLPSLLAARRCSERDLCIGMIVARIVEPRSKLATARGLARETLSSSLAETLGIEDADVDALYAAMDWLLPRQEQIENALASRHFSEGALVLYDVTSTYFEGHACPIAKRGHSRDGRKELPQINIGLMCDERGCPVAVEVFAGNTGDPKTLASQIQKVKTRFGLKRVVVVGDRGTITDARIREDLKPNDLDWISALRAPAIRALVEEGALQLSIFDTKDLAEIRSSDFPDERLMACRNPLLAEERARTRQDLLSVTQKKLDQIVEATRRPNRPLKGKDAIGIRVGKVINRAKMGKHFKVSIEDNSLHYERNEQSIAAEAALDGIYVVRTNLEPAKIDAEKTVETYKSLSGVERAFRSLKTVDLNVHPIHHHLENRVRAHVFLCMLAYYVEWHMRNRLAELLFDDDDKPGARAERRSVVANATVSPTAAEKAATKKNLDGRPVHSFQTLLGDLATICKNRIRPRHADANEFDVITTPTPLQQRALDLLGATLNV